METTLRRVTPAQATAWLRPDINRNNRGLRNDHVEYLAREITNGRWQTTHQGIAFSESGRLLDGQHRLAAIVRAGKSVDINVSEGLPEEAFEAIDCGLKRANHDRIHLVNDSHQNKLLCTSIRMYLFETLHGGAISVGEIEDEFLSKAESWMWVASEFADINNRLLKSGVMAVTGIYHFVKREKAELWMAGYRTGAGLTDGSPVLIARNDALAGAPRDCRYWRVVTLARAHMRGDIVQRVFEATEDMMGNSNSMRLVAARKEKGVKAAITRKRKA